MEQLKTDLRDYFSKDEVFSNATIKGAYDEIPVVSYPLITILEILNEDNQKYDDTCNQKGLEYFLCFSLFQVHAHNGFR